MRKKSSSSGEEIFWLGEKNKYFKGRNYIVHYIIARNPISHKI